MGKNPTLTFQEAGKFCIPGSFSEQSLGNIPGLTDVNLQKSLS